MEKETGNNLQQYLVCVLFASVKVKAILKLKEQKKIKMKRKSV